MFSFIRVAMVIVSLHRNGNPKIANQLLLLMFLASHQKYLGDFLLKKKMLKAASTLHCRNTKILDEYVTPPDL